MDEWSCLVDINKIDFTPKTYDTHPDEDEYEALAQRLGVQKISDVKAKCYAFRVDGGHIVKIEGQVWGKVEQECVVTLKPVEQDIYQKFEAYYMNPQDAVPFAAASKKIKQKQDKNELAMMEEWEDPEMTKDGMIDMAELAIQYISLGVEDFPHAKDADFLEGDDSAQMRQPSDIRKNPFAALQYWKEEE